MKLRQFFILALLILIVPLSACVYRQDISQGNRINNEKLVQLEEGMTKAQVEFLLGTPALIDIHHPDDWYYIHYLKGSNSSEINKRVMTLRFSEDLLMTIKGRDTF